MKKTIKKIDVDEIVKKIELPKKCIFLGNRIAIKKIILSSVSHKFNSDFDLFELEKMTILIDEFRELRNRILLKSERPKVVLLSSFYWSKEVQNAMLKFLEEPPENTYIYLLGANRILFLDTILSRMNTNTLDVDFEMRDLVLEVLSLEPNKRLTNKKLSSLLKQTVDEVDAVTNEETSKKDREAHIYFLIESIRQLLESRKLEEMENSIEYKKYLMEISKHVFDKGGSPNLFIEWLMLTAPKL